jgi:hypothetical protein
MTGIGGQYHRNIQTARKALNCARQMSAKAMLLFARPNILQIQRQIVFVLLKTTGMQKLVCMSHFWQI